MDLHHGANVQDAGRQPIEAFAVGRAQRLSGDPQRLVIMPQLEQYSAMQGLRRGQLDREPRLLQRRYDRGQQGAGSIRIAQIAHQLSAGEIEDGTQSGHVRVLVEQRRG